MRTSLKEQKKASICLIRLLLIAPLIILTLGRCSMQKTSKPYPNKMSHYKKERPQKKYYSRIINTSGDTLYLSMKNHRVHGVSNCTYTGIYQEFKGDSLIFQTAMFEGKFFGIYEIKSYNSSKKYKEVGITFNGAVIERRFYNMNNQIEKVEKSKGINHTLVNSK